MRFGHPPCRLAAWCLHLAAFFLVTLPGDGPRLCLLRGSKNTVLTPSKGLLRVRRYQVGQSDGETKNDGKGSPLGPFSALTARPCRAPPRHAISPLHLPPRRVMGTEIRPEPECARDDRSADPPLSRPRTDGP